MNMRTSFKQEITAVFGKPVAENPTQVIVEAAYHHHGLDWRYLTLEVDPADLGDAVRGARAMGFAGFNCIRRGRCWSEAPRPGAAAYWTAWACS